MVQVLILVLVSQVLVLVLVLVGPVLVLILVLEGSVLVLVLVLVGSVLVNITGVTCHPYTFIRTEWAVPRNLPPHYSSSSRPLIYNLLPICRPTEG